MAKAIIATARERLKYFHGVRWFHRVVRGQPPDPNRFGRIPMLVGELFEPSVEVVVASPVANHKKAFTAENGINEGPVIVTEQDRIIDKFAEQPSGSFARDCFVALSIIVETNAPVKSFRPVNCSWTGSGSNEKPAT
jgi:hypothetical protein